MIHVLLKWSHFWVTYKLFWGGHPHWEEPLQVGKYLANSLAQLPPASNVTEFLAKNKHDILLMEEILHYLGCIKPYKQWDNHHPWWCRILSINSIWCESKSGAPKTPFTLPSSIITFPRKNTPPKVEKICRPTRQTWPFEKNGGRVFCLSSQAI